MKIFISWSGEKSKQAAMRLRDWLPDVIQGVRPWMSASDIEAGARWSGEVQSQLADSRVGILCVTRDNQKAPWLLFEAGALAKAVADTYVCPYLIGLELAHLEPGPLTQFQAKSANESGTRELMRTLNRALKESALPDDKLEKAFERWWPDLQNALAALPSADAPKPRRPTEEVLDELLVATREILRTVQSEQPRSTIDESWLAPGKGSVAQALESLARRHRVNEALHERLNREALMKILGSGDQDVATESTPAPDPDEPPRAK